MLGIKSKVWYLLRYLKKKKTNQDLEKLHHIIIIYFLLFTLLCFLYKCMQVIVIYGAGSTKIPICVY